MLIRLIENDAAFRDDSVLGFVNRDLVSLESLRADAHVNVSFIEEDARVLRTRHALPRRLDIELVRGGGRYTVLCSRAMLHRLIVIEWINVGRVGHRVCDFPIDRVCLLRQYRRERESDK